MLEYLLAQLLILFVLISVLAWLTGKLIFNQNTSIFWLFSRGNKFLSRLTSRVSRNMSRGISRFRKDLWQRRHGGLLVRILVIFLVMGLGFVQFIVALPAEIIGTTKK